MTISTVTPYVGDVPLRSGQTQTEFSVNTGDVLNYMVVYVPEVNTTVGEINTAVGDIDLSVIAADASAVESASSASDAAAALSSVSGTSTTSNTIEAGSKIWITQTGKDFAVGQFVRVSDNVDPINNFVEGTVTAYVTGTGSLTITVEDTSGLGTLSDWTITTTARTLTLAESTAFNLVY